MVHCDGQGTDVATHTTLTPTRIVHDVVRTHVRPHARQLREEENTSPDNYYGHRQRRGRDHTPITHWKDDGAL